jgi:uncharacterized protein (UPF0332 family)
MDETGFLNVADALSTGDTEADWRSGISRAYYAAFHKARRLLLFSGSQVPRGDLAHAYLWLRLSNCGHPDVSNAGRDLNHLRGSRNRADYDFDTSIEQLEAMDLVQSAANIIQLLDDLSKEATILARVLDAIKVYERDVLREVTWHP